MGMLNKKTGEIKTVQSCGSCIPLIYS